MGTARPPPDSPLARPHRMARMGMGPHLLVSTMVLITWQAAPTIRCLRTNNPPGTNLQHGVLMLVSQG